MRTRSTRGLTLVELTLTSVLLAMAVVPFLGALGSLTSQTGQTKLRILARSLARSVLERFRCEPVAVLTARLGSPEAGAAAIDADAALKLPAGPLATLATSVAMRRFASVETTGPHLAVLRVRVTWSEAGRDQAYELSTVVADEVFAEVR